MKGVLSTNFFGNSLEKLFLSIATFLVLIFFFWAFKAFAVKKIQKLAQNTKMQIDDVFVDFLREMKWYFLVSLSLFVSALLLTLPDGVEKIIRYIFLISATVEIIKVTQVFIDFGARKYSSRKNSEYKDAVKTIARIAKFGVWILAGLIALQNLGINISSLVAGLGITGIAIAIAVQGVLGDVFASFSILFDKPFKSGDTIMIGNEVGEVKKIGIKTTRVETLRGEEMIVSNKSLTDSQIHNFTKIEKRRGTIDIGVTYETSYDQLKKVPKIIKDIFEGIEKSELLRVHFKSFGDFSLNFQLVFYAHTSNYDEFLDIQEKINFEIFEKLSKEKIEFAYPTQKLFLEKQA